MKKLRFALPVLAVALALLTSAFTTGQSKGKVSANTQLYWYQVTYDANHPNGVVMNSNDFLVQADRASVSSPCPSGSNADCLRGFSAAITNFPEPDPGSDEIQKP